LRPRREPHPWAAVYSPGTVSPFEGPRNGATISLAAILVRSAWRWSRSQSTAPNTSSISNPIHRSSGPCAMSWASPEQSMAAASRNAAPAVTVKLTTVGAPTPQVTETTVTRAEAPQVLEYKWGGNAIQWKLEAVGGRTRLTLWHNIDRRFISMGAAGWHICLDVLERLLAGRPIGRMVGVDAMKFGGWQRLNAEYASQFGVEAPSWPSPAGQKS